MIALLLASAVALAGAPKDLDYKLIAPSGEVLFEATVTLPAEGESARVELGGVPFSVAVSIHEKHDTVVVEASVNELKGKKEKPNELAHPKLILYEDFEGKVEFKTDVPKKYEGAAGDSLTWTLEATWSFEKPAPAAEEPAPAEEAAPADEAAPASDEAAEAPAAEEG